MRDLRQAGGDLGVRSEGATRAEKNTPTLFPDPEQLACFHATRREPVLAFFPDRFFFTIKSRALLLSGAASSLRRVFVLS